MSKIYQQWNFISVKIKALSKANESLLLSLKINSSDGYGSMKSIFNDAKQTFEFLKKFQNDFDFSLPSNVKELLEQFFLKIKNSGIINDSNTPSGDTLRQQATHLLVELTLMESNLSYLLSDSQAYTRKTAEIAFGHLQRQIVADRLIRESWETGWSNNEREEYFEGLGGAHLLLHKIWAFKVNSTGERTDLVLSEHEFIGDNSQLFDAVDGLILTEWKKVRAPKDLENKIQEAKEQADRYKKGSLSALELSNFCYLVMVSQDHLQIPNSRFSADGVDYRIINIACKPSSPGAR